MSVAGRGSTVELTGWGRTSPTAARVVRPEDPEAVVAEVSATDARGVVARGLGRGYGDCAQNAGGTVIESTRMSGLVDLDLRRGVVTALAGTSLDQLMRWLVPLGWFVPVTPGTRQVTVGGAVASDIHGKNHHVAGTFTRHVRSLRLVDGMGELRELSREQDPDAFRATAGGMGLTGTVVDATFDLVPITSSLLSVDTDRAADLDEVMALMSGGDDAYPYSVAWIDLLAGGRALGRSILERGRFATREEVEAAGVTDPLRFAPRQLPSPPDLFPSGLLNPLTTRMFNEVWFRKAPVRRRDELRTIESFFHPLDMVADWNRIYGPRGFLQWQFVVPEEEGELVHHVVERLSATRTSSFLAVLKRFGPADPGHLSFPRPGWTLALDIPVVPGLERLLDELDERVVEAGGRVYLAKDSRVRPELVPVMYPELDQWRAVRDRLDPDRRIRSDLARRLGLL